MKCNSEKKILIQKIQNKIPKNHQQIVFGDTKLIFYDSQQIKKHKNIKNTLIRSCSRKPSNVQQKGKVNFNFSRPKTGLNYNMSSKDLNALSTSSKQNKEAIYNLKLNIKQPLQNLEFKVEKNLRNPSSSQGKQNILETVRINRSKQKKNSQIPITVKKQPQINKNFRNTNKKQNNKQAFMSKAVNNKQQQVIKVESQLLQHNLGQIPKQTFKHEDVKALFGSIHSLLKINTDYLVYSNIKYGFTQDNDQLMIAKLQTSIKKLQSNLKSAQKQNINNFTNSSIVLNCNSRLFQKSFFSYPAIERAAILKYIKNSQTKKLFQILISQSKVQEKNKKYVDYEFCHENVDIINGRQVQWMYINPGDQVKLFPQHNSLHQKQNERLLQKMYKIKNRSTKQPFFVSFIRLLYLSQPDMIQRIFQPCVNNVFSIWLFLNGCFQPIFVDGFFPLDEKLNHIFGDSGDYLWLPILIKSICKIHNTFEFSVLNSISPKQIYKYLTGIDLQVITNNQISQNTHEQICRIIEISINRGNTPFLLLQGKKSVQILCVDQKEQKKLFSYDLYTQQTKQFINTGKYNQIAIMEPFFNWFIYPFQIHSQSLNKIQIICQRNIEIVFSVGSKLAGSKQISKKRIYVYQSQHCSIKKSSLRTKLTLKQEIVLRDTFRYKLKKGSYKIFIEQGEKKIHMLLSEKSQIKQSNQQSRTQTLTILTSSEVKVSNIEQLYKRGEFLEDSQNLYKDCSSKINPKEN